MSKKASLTSYVGCRPGHLCFFMEIRLHFFQYLEHLPYSMVVHFQVHEYGRCHFSLDLELDLHFIGQRELQDQATFKGEVSLDGIK